MYIIALKYHFIQSARLISFLTLISRILGLLRDAVGLAVLGTGGYGIFLVGFMIPNLFRRLFGEGALSAAMVPVYTETLHNDEPSARRLVRSVLTVLTVFLFCLTVLLLCGVAAWWHLCSDGTDEQRTLAILIAMMLPYVILICLVAAAGGVLNVHKKFFSVAIAPVILNICLIISFYLIYTQASKEVVSIDTLYICALAVLVAGVIQLGMQLWPMKKLGIVLVPLWETKGKAFKKIKSLMVPMVIGLSVVQVNVLFDTILTYTLMATPTSGDTFVCFGKTIVYPVAYGGVAQLHIAQRLYQFPLAIIGIALTTAIFPLLSLHATKKQKEAFSSVVSQGIRLVFFLAIPSAIGLIMIREPLISMLKHGKVTHEDVLLSSGALLFYACGLVSYFLQQLVVKSYYAQHDAKTPAKVAMVMVLGNLVLNFILIWPLGIAGLALSTAITATIQVTILLVIFKKRYDITMSIRLFESIVKSVVATFAMVSVWWLGTILLPVGAPTTALGEVIYALGVTIPIYFIVSLIIKHPEAKSLIRR